MTYDPSTRSNRELLTDWAGIMRVLREREIIRTNNSPTGDIAEALVERALGGKRSHFSNAGWDVRLPPSYEYPGGERVQVKSVRVVPWAKPPANCSPIVDQDYDTVVLVYFDEDFRVTGARYFTREVVEDAFPPRARDGARIIRLTRKFLARDDVHRIDISDTMLDRALRGTA
jgi:hypothetical protein